MSANITSVRSTASLWRCSTLMCFTNYQNCFAPTWLVHSVFGLSCSIADMLPVLRIELSDERGHSFRGYRHVHLHLNLLSNYPSSRTPAWQVDNASPSFSIPDMSPSQGSVFCLFFASCFESTGAVWMCNVVICCINHPNSISLPKQNQLCYFQGNGKSNRYGKNLIVQAEMHLFHSLQVITPHSLAFR